MSPVLNEVKKLQILTDMVQNPKPEAKDHVGPLFMRLARDIFEIQGTYGNHYCIAFKPQGNSLRTWQEIFPDGKLPKFLVRHAVNRLWFCLNWLHAACGVVHTGKCTANLIGY